MLAGTRDMSEISPNITLRAQLVRKEAKWLFRPSGFPPNGCLEAYFLYTTTRVQLPTSQIPSFRMCAFSGHLFQICLEGTQWATTWGGGPILAHALSGRKTRSEGTPGFHRACDLSLAEKATCSCCSCDVISVGHLQAQEC